MKWSNLKQFKCPKCGNDLCQSTIKSGVYECCNGVSCGFSISSSKLRKIVSDQLNINISKKVIERHYRPDDEVPENFVW